MEQNLFALQVVGNPPDEAESNHVVRCMQLFLSHLETVARNCSARCMTNGRIRYRRTSELNTVWKEYALIVRVDGECFSTEMTIKFTEDVWGADGSEIHFCVIWRSNVINKPNPRNAHLYTDHPGTPFLPNSTEPYQLHASVADPYIPRNPALDLNTVRHAAWSVLSKLRRLFIINSLDSIEIESHPLLNFGHFAGLPSEIKQKIIKEVIDNVHGYVDTEILALENVAHITWPKPFPF
jgi:hypothetical protein